MRHALRCRRIDAELITAGAALHRVRGRLGAALRRARRPAGRAAAPTATDLNVENVRAAAAALGIAVDVLPGGAMRLAHGGAVSYAFSSNFEFERLVPYLVCGDKRLTSEILAAEGLPVPRFDAFGAAQFAAAWRFARDVGGAVVAKPARGTAGGAGITLGVRTRAELRAAFARARAFSRDVLVEEQVPGENVRVTILDGEVLGAVRRIPAHVVGDGSATMADLVEAKNALWRAGARENRLLRPIDLDRDALRVLHAHGLGMRSVPAAGQVVALREVSNADRGGEVEDVGPVLHASHLDVARRAAQAVGAVLSGVDLILADLTAAGGAFVNEVNTTPSLYVANAMAGGSPSTHAAEQVLRRLFGLS